MTATTRNLGKFILLNGRCSISIHHGSVVDFSPPTHLRLASAIVNAANERCLGGGGVDRAINMAGGAALKADRCALPILPDLEYNEHLTLVDSLCDNEGAISTDKIEKDDVRCYTGDSKITGPGQYGDLKVPFVIHAVGPNYFHYSGEKGDSLLSSAYSSALQQAKAKNIQCVAFSLISSGIFRGRCTLRHVLKIVVTTIYEFMQKHHFPFEIHLYAFTSDEACELMDVASEILEDQSSKDNYTNEADVVID